MLDTREYELNNAGIQQAVSDIDPFLKKEKVDKQNALRISLTLEELPQETQAVSACVSAFFQFSSRNFK